ncbi:Tat pathway signal sequence domain protein [Streptomyces sp. SID4919]|nr:Tat pathway signal sequence domain protein [Streptomyces sp. AmelKG-E11A]MYY07581.1 Tat pathway signal sequence domain protein [Streptomyces sp. SID4919]
MRQLVRRHLGKVMAGGAIAVAGTALMVAVTLPGTAGADENADGRPGQSQGDSAGQSRQGDPSEQGQADDGEAGTGQDDGQRQGSADADAPPPAEIQAAPTEGEKGIGSDPLTDDELKQAERLASAGDLRRAARDVEGDRGPELLYTNLQEPDPNAPAGQANRMAEVVLYDYEQEATVTKTVDLSSGKVLETVTTRGAQPPPSQGELAEAARLLIAHPLGQDLKKDFRHATGKNLTEPGQAELSGMIFRKDTTLKVPAVLKDCGKNRCLSVVFKVKNGPWIDTRANIVDLSARTVGRLG